MAVRFDPSRPHAKMTQLWHGAAFKQPGAPGGVYFDANHRPLGRAFHDGRWDGMAADPAPGAAPLPPEPHVVWFDDAKTLCTIDGVEFISTAHAPAFAPSQPDRPMTAPSPAPAGAAAPATPPVPPAAPKRSTIAAGADDLTKIKGIGTATAEKLAGLGIATYEGIARLSTDEIRDIEATLNFPGKIERESWIAQATKLLAEKHPEAVVRASTLEAPSTEMNRESVVTWARGEKNHPFGVIRKAMRDLLSVSAPNEAIACRALIDAGWIAESEVDPKHMVMMEPIQV